MSLVLAHIAVLCSQSIIPFGHPPDLAGGDRKYAGRGFTVDLIELPQPARIAPSMNIHQLQLAFDAGEDRLLLRLSTTAGEEFRVFLTRRFVKMLWPHLLRTLESGVVAKAPAAEARREVLAFEHEKAVRETDFSQPFVEPAAAPQQRFPLGDKPFVAIHGQLRTNAPGAYKMILNPGEGRGVEIGLDERLLHSFCQLLESAARSAEWDLAFFPPPAVALPEEQAAAAPPRHMLN